MYVEDLSQIYGCWRCGTLMGGVEENSEGHNVVCKGCGESAILSFTTALDLINDLHVRGILEQEAVSLEDFYED